MTLLLAVRPQATLEVDLGVVTANVRTIKSCTAGELMAVVKADGFGHGQVDVARAAFPDRGSAADRVRGLTDKEFEVFTAVARGLSNAEIAGTAFASESTVKPMWAQSCASWRCATGYRSECSPTNTVWSEPSSPPRG